MLKNESNIYYLCQELKTYANADINEIFPLTLSDAFEGNLKKRICLQINVVRYYYD